MTVRVSVRSFNHAALPIGDVGPARRFYGEVLGLVELERPASFDFPGAWFLAGEVELHLIGEPDPTRRGSALAEWTGGPRRRFSPHLAVEVDDLGETERHLRAHDVPIVGEPRDRGDGALQMYATDPDGHVLEFFVPAARAAGDSTGLVAERAH